MNALIFGANGQDGYYLSKLLKEEKVEVIGVSRSGDWIKGDISNFQFIESIIKYYKPKLIFHFAANSTTSHDALFDNHLAISTGTINLLEATYCHNPDSKIFIPGSAVQFENRGLPIDENTPFAPLSPYAVARIQSVYAGRYFRNLGLKVYMGYFFNHDSPLRSERHINQKIAQAARRIAFSNNEKIEIGNIYVKKEFNYAGDIVNAIWTLINQDRFFEAVIGSGKAYSIKDWAEYCFSKIGKNWQDYIVMKQDFIPEYDILVSNPKLIFSLGWQPKVDFYQLADMMLNLK